MAEAVRYRDDIPEKVFGETSTIKLKRRMLNGWPLTDLDKFAAMMSRRKSKQKKNQNAAHSSRLFNSEIARSIVVKAISKCR